MKNQSLRDFAKTLGKTSLSTLHDKLVKHEILEPVGLMPNRQYVELEYFEMATVMRKGQQAQIPYVTQKGAEFISKLLK